LQESGKIPTAINLPLSSLQETLGLSEDAFEEKFGFPKPEKDKVTPHKRIGLTERRSYSIVGLE
jgi:hypothetical protein